MTVYVGTICYLVVYVDVLCVDCPQGVTKGARHKIVLNIARLKERQNVLRAMEKVSL